MRRTWLFVPGADRAAHERAARSGADVIVLELEDFTPPELRAKARALAGEAFGLWRSAGALAALSGDAELVPNVETARGLRNTFEIGRASARVRALLVASEDMVADLGTERSRGGAELAYVRSRFLVECRAAGVEAIDCPYTFSDVKGAVADARQARRLGYRMKSLVDPSHAKAINQVFTPGKAELAKARKIVAAFEKARAAGRERAHVDGALVEVPIYAAAKRLLEREGA
jgi:citrate lyase subunit beta/citryl-CoA lyase